MVAKAVTNARLSQQPSSNPSNCFCLLSELQNYVCKEKITFFSDLRSTPRSIIAAFLSGVSGVVSRQQRRRTETQITCSSAIWTS
ncbi:hypothetical protein L596_029895 [Steinernema carpocapsae]|uniref:Uncharacterized protein n=1 Tax=Steinernema carpocapsae TaxID=34508 RepID=A0A4U5LR53_STECR|nr:hypothetical protein L596_029895 [Steinernema carpocapsae]